MSSRRYGVRRARREVSTSWTWRWRMLLGVAASAAVATVPGVWGRYAVVAVAVLATCNGALALRRRRIPVLSAWLPLLLCRGSAVVGLALIWSDHPGHPGLRTAIGEFALLPYPLVALSALLLLRSGRGRPFWIRTLEVAMLAAGTSAAAWCLILLPVARAGRLPLALTVFTIGYAVLDLVALVGTGRPVFGRSPRVPAPLPVFAAALVTAVADVVWYDPSGWLSGWSTRAAVAGWLVGAVLLAGACRHPALDAWRPDLGTEEYSDAPDARLGRYTLGTLLVTVAAPVGAAWSGSLPAVAIAAALAGTFAALAVRRFALAVRAERRRARELERRAVELWGQARGLGEQASTLSSALQEHRQQQRDLEFRATHDQLTKLANRALLTQRLDHALNQVGRHSGLAFMLLDLDGFKAVNDTLGHLVGDDLLRAVAHRLTEVVPAQHTLARLGGDEFAILATGMREPAEALALAEEVVAATSRPYVLGEREITVTVSVGVRHLPRFRAEPLSDLMRHADMAMYTAKRGGRNRAAMYAVEPAAAPVVVPHRFTAAAAHP